MQKAATDDAPEPSHNQSIFRGPVQRGSLCNWTL